jgi:hypothetical protein
MISRSLYPCLAAVGIAFLVGLPAPVSAAPGVVAAPSDGIGLVQNVDYYNRRWRYRNGTHVRAPLTAVDDRDGDTWVRAPFARVYSGRRGTWVRAPFVNLWIPR